MDEVRIFISYAREDAAGASPAAAISISVFEWLSRRGLLPHSAFALLPWRAKHARNSSTCEGGHAKSRQ
jgi:hypothetical protein